MAVPTLGNSITRISAFRVGYPIRNLLRRGREHPPWSSGAYRRTRALQDSCRGRDALVVATGPSVRTLDSEVVMQRQDAGTLDVIGLNMYESARSYVGFPPADYYVLSDPMYFCEKAARRQILTDRGYEDDVIASFLQHYESTIERLVDRSTTVFAPYGLVSNGTTHGLELAAFDGRVNPFSSNLLSLRRPLGVIAMTTYRALSVALWLGYDRVFLTGADLDWFTRIRVDSSNRISYTYEHFYDDEPVDHQDPRPLAVILDEALLHLRCLRRFAGTGRISILGQGSLVDVLPRSTLRRAR